MAEPRYRIMIVLTPAFVPTAGGVQMSTSKMARWFSSAGHQVMIFSFANPGTNRRSSQNLRMLESLAGALAGKFGKSS